MNDILKALTVMHSLFGKQMDKDAARVMIDDLSQYPEPAVLKALQRCRREIPRFPTIAEIIARIDDGYPGVEEAWALCPKTESDSVVWTQEIAGAFFAARTLLPDPVAARMTFKEVYTKELQRARDERRSPKWYASLGHDQSSRDAVLIDAVTKKRISIEHAKGLVPELPDPTLKKLLLEKFT